ncbi:MAG: alpha/beta hydrolase [Reyranella sp.]|nr:alpha/beta hydrolase [Reyranella sp.]
MLSNDVCRERQQQRGHVIALHCSGSDARQWRQLGEMLGPRYELLTPEHYGSAATGPWTGTHAFTLADEAVRTIALIDATARNVHLVGHSYGGAIALHAALERPGRVETLTLYEPSAFHLLKQIDAGGADALAEIAAIARLTGDGAVTGDYQGAATAFIDYWSGNGTWATLRPELRSALTQWLPKAPLDFTALIGEPTKASDYARLRCSTLIIRGERAPLPTRLIAEALPTLLPNARLTVVAGAGHMGPLTHAAEVNAVICRHLAGVEVHGPHAPLVAPAGSRDRGMQRNSNQPAT